MSTLRNDTSVNGQAADGIVTAPGPQHQGPRQRLRSSLKGALNLAAIALAAMPAVLCWLENHFSSQDYLFHFWSQAFACAPGLPGKYLRRAFYYLTLRSCSLTCEIEFMACLNHRGAALGRNVYVGAGAMIGMVTVGEGCLIGTRASILNGSRQHEFNAEGRLTACDRHALPRVHIGAHTWVGEAAIIMADVGDHCIVAAGSVVASPVPAGSIVGGNPVRFVGKVPGRSGSLGEPSV